MSENRFENLLIKYLSGQASENDIEELSLWIKKEENQKLFDEYVKLHFDVSTVFQKEEIDPLKKKLLLKISESEKKKLKSNYSNRLLKYVALCLVLISVAYFTSTQFGFSFFNKGVEKNIQEKFVTLETEEGELVRLLPSNQKVITNAKGNSIGNQNRNNLFYDNDVFEAEPTFVTIHVPYGKKFKLDLADGTTVHLNSGSSLRYPTFFKNSESRSVSLTGEAFFEVAKDSLHPFYVESNSLQIEVLGTKFNVTNYKETSHIRTVLLEGAVSLNNSHSTENVLLKPGQKAALDKADKSIAVTEVDTYEYTAWMQGKLIFRNKAFKEICHALERKYDVQITVENDDLKEEVFDASFDIETIEQVLESFKRSYSFEYTLDSNHILIK